MAKEKSNYFIYFAAVSINLICFSTGTAYSWTSPLIPKFESNDSDINPIDRPLTSSESGLLVSVINLGLFIGPSLPGILAGKLGKKLTLLITALPLLVAHIICAAAHSLEVFLVARFLMGLATGSVWAVIPGYVSEISEPRNRGVLNSLIVVASCSGSLFTYLTGPFVSVMWFSFLNLIPVALFLTSLCLFIPKSPYDLVMKNNREGAKESLIQLRQKIDVQQELLEIERIIETNSKNHAKLSNIFKNRASSKALLICSGLMTFNAFSGVLIILGYTQTIFDIAGSSIPSAYSAIMCGFVSLFSSIVSSQLIDRLGRRPLIILSSVIACISHTTLGIFFHLQNNGFDTQKIGWLPICSVIFCLFAFYFGLAPLPWVILGELFASNIKTVASTFCTTINFGLSFAVTLAYPYIVASVGIANAFLFFAVMMAACVIFCFLKIPETKGKTFEEIYALLNGKH